MTNPVTSSLDDRVAARAGSGPLRLTRRGRAVLLVITTMLLFAAFSVGRVTTSAATPQHYRTVVLRPGQTLWSVASAAAPDSDPRVTVARIEALNHLDGAVVQPGQRLRVPS